MYYIPVANAVDLYVGIIEFAFPCAIVFGFGNILVNMFLGALYTGRVTLTGRGSR